MLNTSGMSAGSGKEKPVIGPGNNVVKINSITFDVTPYAADAFNIMLHVESEPMEGEFQGFLEDANNPSGPRYKGQVGRIRFAPYPYKDAILPNGSEISRDTEVMKAMIFLSEQLDKRKELDAIQANTIEDFMSKCNAVLSGPTYLNMCFGTREWENKEGYVNNDLYLPKLSKAGVPIEALDVENSRLITYNTSDKNHYRALVKKDVLPTSGFEPASTAGDDFEL
jgi:hypothetical protein|tara:strand:+ start:11539 stop:12213 length:675 start_codon:yes stop_codon:yes gene_type:complete